MNSSRDNIATYGTVVRKYMLRKQMFNPIHLSLFLHINLFCLRLWLMTGHQQLIGIKNGQLEIIPCTGHCQLI